MINFAKMISQADINQAIEVMRKGGVILYPTDTVWGIGCDATCDNAVKRIFAIKQRPDSKALITLVGSMGQLERLVDDAPDVALDLVELSTRAVTVVYDHVKGVSTALLAPDGSAAVRLTREPFSAALCQRLGHPVVSTSANISGRPSPACFSEISQEILGAVDYVCQSRRDETAKATPSMVIKISNDSTFKILRK